MKIFFRVVLAVFFCCVLSFNVFADDVKKDGTVSDDSTSITSTPILLSIEENNSAPVIRSRESSRKLNEEFITMPREMKSNLIKSVYEDVLFKVDDQKGLVSKKEIGLLQENVKKYWIENQEKNVSSGFKKLTLYFVPKGLRKFGEKFLRDFKMEFEFSGNKFNVMHEFAGTRELYFYPKESSRSWLKTPNKTDVLLFIPRQNNANTKAFMICQRANELDFYNDNSVLNDVGYAIDKVGIVVTGQGKGGITTGSIYEGKANLDIITSDIVTPSEVKNDKSAGRDPKVELSYLQSENKTYPIFDDSRIVGGLKFLFTMQYQSGQKRVSDFTNYIWIDKENISLPMSFSANVGGERKRVAIGFGNCYLIAVNAKTVTQVYTKEPFKKY